jgi:ceramide synthetase
MEIYDGLRNWFWDRTFWLPANRSWDDLVRNNTPGSPFYPDFYDLWIPFPVAVGLFAARLVWERFIAQPVGRHYGVSESPPAKVVRNDILENAFKHYRRTLPGHSQVVGLAKQLDWSPRQVERWWRRRRVQGKPSEMQRFKETSWRFLFYITSFWGGLYVIWDKSWLWDTKHCWYGYPLQHVTDDIWWYYMLELGFYWSLVMSLFMDINVRTFYR